jgi:hypothetical protein
MLLGIFCSSTNICTFDKPIQQVELNERNIKKREVKRDMIWNRTKYQSVPLTFFPHPEENFDSHKTTNIQLSFCAIIGLPNAHTMKFFIFLCRHVNISIITNKLP